MHTTETTVRKWVARARAGEPLRDRSLCPRANPRQRERRTLQEIATLIGVSRATVGRIVARCGWSRLHVLELPPTARRYERSRRANSSIWMSKSSPGSCGLATASAVTGGIP